MRFFFFIFVFVLSISSAQADVFTWKDDLTGVSVTFPDRWRVTHNQKADDILTISAPQFAGDEDYAGCRIRVRDDRRFAIYPARFGDEIQRQNFGALFLERYLAEFNDTAINHFQNNAGIGRAPAMFADVSFETALPPKMGKRGIVFAGLYANQVHIVECSAREDRFSYWEPIFEGIVQSVKFDQIIQPSPTGKYRNFLGDKALVVYGPSVVDTYTF